MKLKDVKRGEFFTKKAVLHPSESQVWVRGDYDRSAKKFEIYRFDDVCRSALMSGDKEVFTEFIF